MESDYDYIKKLVSDSKQISYNTDVPLYKVLQLKTELFYKNFSEQKICSWWLRLYNDKFTQNDLKILRLKISEM